MFTTQIRCLRDTTDLLQTLVNKEYARGSFGEGLVTLTRGGGVQTPLSCAVQVSDLLDV